MTDIEKLIQDLQSDDLEKKYDACKQLECESQLPDEAINALRIASKDSDPLIAVTASRALNVHTETITIPDYQLENKYKLSLWTPMEKVLMTGFSAFIAFFSTSSIYFNSEKFEDMRRWVAVWPLLCVGTALLTTILAIVITYIFILLFGHRMHKIIVVLFCLVIGAFCGFIPFIF